MLIKEAEIGLGVNNNFYDQCLENKVEKYGFIWNMFCVEVHYEYMTFLVHIYYIVYERWNLKQWSRSDK